jgi:sulfur-oxidizing protein SoxB
MVRVGGIGYTLDPAAPMGRRVRDMVLLRTGAAIDPGRDYSVAGWASINQGTEGPPIWSVVEAHLRRHGTVKAPAVQAVKLIGN